MKVNPQSPSLTWNDRQIRGLIFDMDGVVADTYEAHAEAWRLFAESEGITIDARDFLHRTFGRTNRDILPILYNRTDLDEATLKERGHAKELMFVELFKQGAVPPVKGAVEFIRRLHQHGVPLVLGTSAERMNADLVLSSYGIADCFKAIVSGEDVTHAKPHPEVFLKCCERLGFPPHECVVFEDSTHGLKAGRAAGCLVIGLATTHSVEEIGPLCEMAVPDFRSLLAEAVAK